MKRLKKYRMTSSRHDSPKAGRHIHSFAILAFAIEGADFTKQENAHFDVCRACRLEVLEALEAVKNVAGLPAQMLAETRWRARPFPPTAPGETQ